MEDEYPLMRTFVILDFLDCRFWIERLTELSVKRDESIDNPGDCAMKVGTVGGDQQGGVR
jgi:hypothetical protein